MKVTSKDGKGETARSYSEDWALLDKTTAEIEKDIGTEVCESHLKGSLKIARQNKVRILLKEKKTDKEIFASLKDWRPGIKKEGKSPVEKAKAAYGKLSDEERKQLLADLKAGKI